MFAILVVAIFGFIVWKVLTWPNMPTRNAVNLMYENFMLEIEAMRAAKEMMREAVRQQHSFSEPRKNPWEE